MCKKILAFLSVLLVFSLVAVCCLSASSEGNLLRIFDAGKTLLFDTENVTVSGHAEFTLDGERFKTADILYKQDSTYSHWQLDLLTPRPDAEDRETGYTIIANGEKIIIMEKYNPGFYTVAYDEPSRSLLRQSAASDLLVTMAYALADPIEGLLPEGAMAVSETAGGTEVQITLTQDTAPAMLNPLMNSALQFALRRFMGVDFDHIADWGVGPFDSYPTVTQSVICTTSSYLLGDTSVTVVLDENGRLASVRGTVNVILSSRHERQRTVTVTFNLSVSDYGKTYVRTFDADAFGVVPAV